MALEKRKKRAFFAPQILKVLMDLETENRIAAILLKEAAELRRQAEKEGVHVYLQKPKARGRPNSRFLTATVLGVQQANKAVEVNEMWRIRQKELELDDRISERSTRNKNSRNSRDMDDLSRNRSKRPDVNEDSATASCLSREAENGYSREDEGLRDEDVENLLQSRVKRGRGGVGPRMDETGPYLPPSDDKGKLSSLSDARADRVVFGPEKPSTLKSYESSEEELDEVRRKRAKKVHSRSSHKKHCKKHRCKEKTRDKKRRREEKRRK
ncbi:hypothetical protein Tsubulata_020464 [Turnera subulata]|uniref:Uncharacterized protein n=1 Tax=Turnera subulata TaxID=218843 RepID=A0A9Q0GEJ7_9ROSI|nr:hypothetical protein Tsubulata_020464 [Turnera subulata]